MRPVSVVALCTLLVSVRASRAQDSPDSQVTRAVLAAEDARFTAMLRADTTALRGLLADDLQYVHSSGRIETKPQFLHAVGSRTIQYLSLVPVDRRVIRLDTAAATVVGRAKVHVISGGTDLDVEIRYVSVYSRAADRWQLRAWQSVRLSAPEGR